MFIISLRDFKLFKGLQVCDVRFYKSFGFVFKEEGKEEIKREKREGRQGQREEEEEEEDDDDDDDEGRGGVNFQAIP